MMVEGRTAYPPLSMTAEPRTNRKYGKKQTMWNYRNTSNNNTSNNSKINSKKLVPVVIEGLTVPGVMAEIQFSRDGQYKPEWKQTLDYVLEGDPIVEDAIRSMPNLVLEPDDLIRSIRTTKDYIEYQIYKLNGWTAVPRRARRMPQPSPSSLPPQEKRSLWKRMMGKKTRKSNRKSRKTRKSRK